MDANDVGNLIADALFTILICAGPVLAVALIVGVMVSLFQAITQIQEMTLTFVPKIIGIFLSVLFFMSHIFNNLNDFSLRLFDLIKSGSF